MISISFLAEFGEMKVTILKADKFIIPFTKSKREIYIISEFNISAGETKLIIK
jgi:hypothetical protein